MNPAGEFLLEIGCEELPPQHINSALNQLVDLVGRSLQESAIHYQGEIRTYGTPRRLVLLIVGLSEQQADQTIEIKGPPRSAAFKSDGSPTGAGLGFAKKMGVNLDQIQCMPTERGDYLVYRRVQPGRRTVEILAEKIPEWLRSVVFPRSMRWGKGDFRFSRPIRSLVVLFDGKVVPTGIDGLRSGLLTTGHYRLAPEPFEVRTFQDYRDRLAESWVIIDTSERASRIKESLQRDSAACGGRLIEDPELLQRVARSSEYPVVISGRFDSEFLELPKPVLVTSMRTHQKFFALETDSGALLPCFLHVIDNPKADLKTVIRGNEKVLTARLNDARFFFSEDRRSSLEQRLPKSSGITLHEQLGSMEDKTRRLTELTPLFLADLFPDSTPLEKEQAGRAAKLCKADLTTLMVGEFPDLQGVMGQEYALLQGESPEIATAIGEHYLPRTAVDQMPRSRIGITLAIADRIDTLCGYFTIGLIPTGSEDPYALRRAAAGICQILLQQCLEANLQTMIDRGIDQLSRVKGDEAAAKEELKIFFIRRLEGIMAGGKCEYDTIDACLVNSWKNPADLYRRIEALTAFRSREDFEALIVGFRRVARIIPQGEMLAFDENLLEDETEKVLHQTLIRLEPRAMAALARQDYQTMLATMAEFKTPIDHYFDDVMVMCDNEALRNNRLSLLTMIVHLFGSFADFTRLVISQDRTTHR